MPSFKHTVESDYIPSFRTESVAGMFDVPATERLTREWDIDMPIEDIDDWGVGVIVGPSGAGKTTIAKTVFGEENYFDGSKGFDWPFDKSLLDGFSEDLSIKEITTALSKVGFSSPPVWMLPFDKLSNGQKFRAEMARLILDTKGTAVVDEFTSVVDRNVAKMCSFAIQKFVRRAGRKMVAVSCHYDIIDWLEPDWVYYVDTGEFKRGSLRRPKIDLKIQRVHHSAWKIFKGHHYLSADINKSSRCFMATVNGDPVAFVAALKFPHHSVRNMWKSHRTVVLPDYQGIGIGGALNNAVGQHFLDIGGRFTGVASHPAMNAHRAKSPLWKMTRKPSMVPPTTSKGQFKNSTSLGRVTASFEFIGEQK